MNFKFENLSNSCSVDSKSREVAPAYAEQLRMNVSGSTNREFQISKSFQFMCSLFKIKISGSYV